MADLTSGELAELLGGEVRGSADVPIADLTHDSRQIRPGWAFCAVRGLREDGRVYVADAMQRGAALVILGEPDPGVGDQIVVADVRRALGPAAAAVHAHPSQELDVIGVTGTNGKTTVVSLLAGILEAAGRRPRTIGTLTGARTTPEAPDLQRQLRQWVDEGVRSVAMEVSSHALDLHRIDGTRVRVAVFTNLGEDHLDFHQNLERYFAAKAALFEPAISDVAVVNVDDVHGRLLGDSAPIETFPFSLHQLAALELGRDGSRFLWRGHRVDLALPGRFNVSNALAAAEASLRIGIDPPVIAAALSAAGAPPGRFESVEAGQAFAVIVDYAHTPDALANVLVAARELGGGTLRVVFGAGGDRDPGKRPRMGAVASEFADEVVITTDNPRSEDPATIIDAVVAGCSSPPVVIADRREAIAHALGRSVADDVVVIAGKGHETTQTIGDHVEPFDDREVAAAILGGSADQARPERRA